MPLLRHQVPWDAVPRTNQQRHPRLLSRGRPVTAASFPNLPQNGPMCHPHHRHPHLSDPSHLLFLAEALCLPMSVTIRRNQALNSNRSSLPLMKQTMHTIHLTLQNPNLRPHPHPLRMELLKPRQTGVTFPLVTPLRIPPFRRIQYVSPRPIRIPNAV